MEKCIVHSWSDNKYKVVTIHESIPDDLYISCISYEPRSLGLLKKLDKNYKAEVGVFIMNERFERFKKVKSNKKEIDRFLEKTSFFNHRNDILASIDNPIKILIEVDKIIKQQFGKKQRINITFDITTFARSELLTLIYYLRHLPTIDTIRIVYVSPIKYGDWLSEGYLYSMVPPFFEGSPTFEKKTALLILAGFEYDRAVSLIEDLEPSALIIGRPHPGTASEFEDFGETIIQKLRRTRKIQTHLYDIPANNPFRCRDFLRNSIQEHLQEYNFFVAPMGTKLEVFGAYLAYEKDQNFRMIYPVTQIYNVGSYSSGCRDVYEVFLSNVNNKK